MRLLIRDVGKELARFPGYATRTLERLDLSLAHPDHGFDTPVSWYIPLAPSLSQVAVELDYKRSKAGRSHYDTTLLRLCLMVR